MAMWENTKTFLFSWFVAFPPQFFFLTLLCKNCIKKLEKTKNMYIKDVNEY